MLNIARKGAKIGNSFGKKIFNSCPLDFKGVKIDGVKQINYTNYQISSGDSIESLLNQLKNSNPSLKFVNSTIIGNEFYDEEKSELVNKPDKDIWKLKDLGNGLFSVTL